MARNDPQMNLRLPVELKEQIEDAAAQNNRTLTAEVVGRLQESFDPNIASLSWVDLVKILEQEAKKRGTRIRITFG